MFFIRNKAIAQTVRSSRNLFKTQEKKTSPTPQPVKQTENTGFVMATEDFLQPYPYKFGGITNKKKNEPRIESLLPSKLPNFFHLYIELLNSIQKKDLKALNSLLEPDLIQPLLSRNVKLIHPSSASQIQFNTFATGMGVGGKRDPDLKYTSMAPPSMNELGQNVKVYMPQSPTAVFDLLNKPNMNGFPIMLSAEITIRSKARLIQAASPEKEQEQTHILTFQRQSQLNITSAMQMLPGLRMALGGTSGQKMKNLLYDSEGSWKIGNIDSFFKNRWQ